MRQGLWPEIMYMKLGATSALFGAYYKPHEYDPENIASFEELKKILTFSQPNKLKCLASWGLNLPKVGWENLIQSPDCDHPTFYRECLEVRDDCLFEQMVTSHTRVKYLILNLFLTTNPTLVDKCIYNPRSL